MKSLRISHSLNVFFPSFLFCLFTFGLNFLVGSDDGHEELLAAASAVINPGTCH